MPLIHGKGEWGKQVTRIIKRNRRTEDAQRKRTKKPGTSKPSSSGNNQGSSNSAIERILFLDRTVDPITPLLTQWTYEGVLDEILSIRLCTRLRTRLYASTLAISF